MGKYEPFAPSETQIGKKIKVWLAPTLLSDCGKRCAMRSRHKPILDCCRSYFFILFFNQFSFYCVQCSSFHAVSGGPFGFTGFRSLKSVSHPQEFKLGLGRCLCQRVLSGVSNFYHNLVFDYEIVRYVDGFFEPSCLVVIACCGYICCVEKALHVAKLWDRLFAPQAFNSIWFYSHAPTPHCSFRKTLWICCK